MGEIAGAQGGAAEVLEAAVAGPCRAVAGARWVEKGEHVFGPSFQGSSEMSVG